MGLNSVCRAGIVIHTFTLNLLIENLDGTGQEVPQFHVHGEFQRS